MPNKSLERDAANSAAPLSFFVRPKETDMWCSLSKPDLGFMNVLDGVVSRAAGSFVDWLPDLHSSPTLIATSDYSGHQKGAPFEVYAILIVGSEGWGPWEEARLRMRRAFRVGRRRISFKGLNDVRKRNMLPSFLSAADQLPGVCVALVVHRSIRSLFCKDGFLDLRLPEMSAYGHYDRRVFERLLRVVHFVSFFLAGLSCPRQDVLWFTDQDDIAANQQRVVELTGIWANVFSHYLRHDLRHIKCGTTECDNGTLQIEDLTAVPDLVAGALGELLNHYAAAEATPSSQVIVPAPAKLTYKSKDICIWFARRDAQLKRLVYVIEEEPATRSLRVKDLRLHAIETRTV